MHSPMLIDVVEVSQSAEDAGKKGGRGYRSPDRSIVSVKGLQFLDTCQVTRLQQLGAQLASGPIECLGDTVDGELDVLDGAGVIASCEGDQQDEKVVQRTPGIVDTVSDPEIEL